MMGWDVEKRGGCDGQMGRDERIEGHGLLGPFVGRYGGGFIPWPGTAWLSIFLYRTTTTCNTDLPTLENV